MKLFGSARQQHKPAAGKRGHVIVVGNEKGGSGKSTTAMHVAVGLMRQGYSVATLDLDARQGTLSRYISNRQKYIQVSGNKMSLPDHYRVDPPAEAASAETEKNKVGLIIEGAMINHDAVLVDAPGSDNPLSRLAHSYADTLITPINDSLVDFDVLAHVDGQKMQILAPSHYAEMVWEQKKIRAERDGGSIDWMVVRNRISSLDTHNAREVNRLVSDLSKRIGFRVVPGFSERVIFRELFLVGLTILDLKDAGGAKTLSPSHHAAREEVMTVVNAIGVPAAKAAAPAAR